MFGGEKKQLNKLF